MQVGPETKWKRDQNGKWSRVEAPSKPVVATTGLSRRPDVIPGVTFRIRTGKAVSCIAGQPKLVAIANGPSVSIYKGPESRPLQISSSSIVKGICLTPSVLMATYTDGHMSELDTATGKVRLTSPELGGIPASAPIAAMDGWIVTLESGAVVALSGKLSPKWRFSPPAGTFGFQTATSVGRGVYVPGESTLYRLDSASGLVNWNVELGDRGCVTPAVAAGLVISAATNGGISCLDAATGKLRWRVGPETTGSVTWTGVAIAALHVIAATQQGDVVCVNRETGRLLWVRSGIGGVMFAPLGDVKHGCAVVFVQDTDAGIPAEVLGLDLRSGRTMWRARVGNLDAAPALTGDRLWIASSTGTLYAFDYG